MKDESDHSIKERSKTDLPFKLEMEKKKRGKSFLTSGFVVLKLRRDGNKSFNVLEILKDSGGLAT